MASSDFVYHHATGRDLSKEAYKQMAMMSRDAFSDYRIEIADLFGEEVRVACRLTITGTHTGEYQGIPPTGNIITFQGIEIFRIADGKIAEIWSRVNLLSVMQQLGVIPPMGKG